MLFLYSSEIDATKSKILKKKNRDEDASNVSLWTFSQLVAQCKFRFKKKLLNL